MSLREFAPSCRNLADANSNGFARRGSPVHRAKMLACNHLRHRSTSRDTVRPRSPTRMRPRRRTATHRRGHGDERDRLAAVLVGGAAVSGARRVRRRPLLAMALRPVWMDEPLDAAPGATPAQVG